MRHVRRISFLIIGLALLLSGCTENKSPSLTTVDGDYSYTSTEYEIYPEYTIVNALFSYGGIALVARENIDSSQKIVEYSVETQAYAPFNYQPPSSRDILYIVATSDNCLWLVEEEADQVFLKKVNEAGAVIFDVNLNVTDNNPINSFAATDGHAVLLVNNSLTVFNSNGEDLGSYSSTYQGTFCVAADADGYFYLPGIENGSQIKRFNPFTLKWEEVYQTSYLAMNLRSGEGLGYDLCYYTDTALFGYDIQNYTETRIVEWSDFGYSGNNIRSMEFPGNDQILCFVSAEVNGIEERYFSMLSAADQREKNMTALVLATYYIQPEIKQQVENFNRYSDEYIISIIDYAEYNTDYDQDAGIAKLKTDLITGNYPDIIDFTNIRSEVEMLANGGYLSNLYDLIENDEQMDASDFVSSVFSSAEYGGGLYEIIPSFSIVTAAAPKSIAGSAENWSVGDYKDYIEVYGNVNIFPHLDENDILKLVLNGSINQYIDWSARTVDFSSGGFANLLTFCKEFADRRVEGGDSVIINAGISNFLEIQYYEAILGGEITFIGYPSEYGSGSYAMTTLSIGMTSMTENADVVWEFLRGFLSEDYQRAKAVSEQWREFPTNKKVLEEMISYATTKELAADGMEVSKGGISFEDGEIKFFAASEEHIIKVMNLIDSIEDIYQHGSSKILQIIQEETAGYFAGDQSVETVINVIENRVKIYISEQS